MNFHQEIYIARVEIKWDALLKINILWMGSWKGNQSWKFF